MPAFFEKVYIDATARHLPGPAIDSASMDAFVAPLNRISSRIKKRILEENGIRTRHYGIDADGTTRESPESMAARAITLCLADAHRSLDEVGMLATGGCAGDALLPGFANMLLGELAGPPMQLLTSQGICASGLAAWEAAASAIELENPCARAGGRRGNALTPVQALALRRLRLRHRFRRALPALDAQ